MRLLIIIISLSITGSTAFSQSQTPTTKLTKITGTRVSLIPPQGFTPAAHFPGYELESVGASIMVIELPASFSEVAPSLSDSAALLKRGMSFVSREDVKLKGISGALVKVTQNKDGIDYVKHLLVFGDERKAVLIVATVTQSQAHVLAEKMKASLLSATWDSGLNLSTTEGLKFEVNQLGDLRIANRTMNLLSYTRGGIFPSQDINDPLFIVGESFSKVAPVDIESFAKARMLQTTSVTNIKLEQAQKVSIDKLRGYEIIANATDAASRQPMLLYQVVLVEEENYYLMQGLVTDRHRDKYLTVFKEMARSFKRKPAVE